MRLIYFTYGYSPHDRRFLTALARTDHSVHYLPLTNSDWETAQGEIPAEIWVEEPVQNSGRIQWLRYPGLVRQLEKRLNIIQPELIHAGPIHLSAALAALTDFHPLVSMSWGSDLLRSTRNPWVAMMARYALARSDAFVGDCKAVKSAAIRYGMNEERIIIFPWGVDLNHFSPKNDNVVRNNLGWENNFILISTRSFEPLYGVDLILRAFIQLAQTIPELKLLLLGDGSQREHFERWLSKEGLLDRVHFPGVVEKSRLPEYYRAADVYVSASRSDGSSVSLLEALACGVPALVSDIPGNCEWVDPGTNGWRFRDGDVHSLVSVLNTLIQEPERLGELGVAARTIAERRANWHDNFSKLSEAYQIAVDHVNASAS